MNRVGVVLVLAACGGNNAPPVVVGDCGALPAAGTWQEITPPEVKAGFGKLMNYGTFAFVVDPVNAGTVYLGTTEQGVWRSSDCGANWTHVDSGRNGAGLDGGMNWTFAIDPTNPDILYTASGYGLNGLFKSVNAGVDWDAVWPPPGQPDLRQNFTYNFANVIAMDPNDHQHILLTFHESCLMPGHEMCIAESMDGGTSWRLLGGDPSWSGSEGQVIFFLDSSRTWLWGSQTNGFWRSEDAGASWTAIQGMTTSHLQASQVYRRPSDGTFFVAAASDGVWRSPDGKIGSWRLVPNTGPIGGGIVSDGDTMYFSNCYFGDFCKPAPMPYFTSPESDGDTWTRMQSPPLNQGGNLGFDRSHHILYSSNLQTGFWRYITR